MKQSGSETWVSLGDGCGRCDGSRHVRNVKHMCFSYTQLSLLTLGVVKVVFF